MAYVDFNSVDKIQAKNKMADLANLFDLELDDEFVISLDGSLANINKDFRFTESGLEVRVINAWEPAPLPILEQLLLGKGVVRKIPWKAAPGEPYYVPVIGKVEKSHRYIYAAGNLDDYSNGLMCKTEKQAEALSDILIQVARNFQGIE